VSEINGGLLLKQVLKQDGRARLDSFILAEARDKMQAPMNMVMVVFRKMQGISKLTEERLTFQV
jgi:hypothetical protein